MNKNDIEVYIDWQNQTSLVGLIRRQSIRGKEIVSFEYSKTWLNSNNNFAIEPFLKLTKGVFVPNKGLELFVGIGDSAPDQWGRRLMRRAERRNAEKENRTPRTLFEMDYLLGVSDETRLGALRFKTLNDDIFLSPKETGVPSIIDLGNLLGATERILRDEETDEDLQMIFAPGSSLGGARPKASVVDQHKNLAIAKFPKETDEYSLETWEEIALILAKKAGIKTPEHELIKVANKPVLLSKRFDRIDNKRVPFVSAMSMTGSLDGEGGSYLDIVDVISQYGSQAKKDKEELFKRMVFNILISNTDDHLRNHGFLRVDNNGWTLSPAYDLNPTPQDIKPRILSTKIDFDDGTCSIDLALEVASLFGLKNDFAKEIIKDVAKACSTWKEVAKDVGAKPSEIKRMTSAFEHEDLKKAIEF